MPDTLELYERVIATIPGLARKGQKTPYTSRNGHMFSFLTAERELALRLPADAREELLARHDARLCEQHGRVMKEYVIVPAALLARTKALARYFAVSHDYVGALKPKPTTRPTQRAATKRSTATAAKQPARTVR
ncbi:MAG: hypothetical protein R3A51_09175 [Nannocystaceae bacterium]|nr:hypothetical protein [Myxococcales bacterium]